MVHYNFPGAWCTKQKKLLINLKNQAPIYSEVWLIHAIHVYIHAHTIVLILGWQYFAASGGVASTNDSDKSTHAQLITFPQTTLLHISVA